MVESNKQCLSCPASLACVTSYMKVLCLEGDELSSCPLVAAERRSICEND